MINIEINYQTKVPIKLEMLFKTTVKSIENKLKINKRFLLSVVIISPIKIKQLNSKYRRKNKTTDVLSFPEVNEIFICYQKAVRQAKRKGNSIREELSWLLCHGVLHLLGYDHHSKKEEKVMRILEKEILQDFIG